MLRKNATLGIAAALLAGLCISVTAGAHPPKSIELAFNEETKTLEVTFTHSVKDPEDHFIEKVTVLLDDKEIISQKCKIQATEEGGSLVYRIPEAKEGSKISVVAKCNKMGRRKKGLVIGEEKE